MPEAVIVSAVRTPVGRAYKGSLRTTRPDDLAALAIKEALARVPALDPKNIDDVVLGCAMPEGEQGMNVARIASLRAGLPVETSAMTINRFCSSGLQAIAIAAERIRSGGAEVIVAGGTESMSMVPMGGNKISPNPWLMDHYPDTYINMGLGTENIARKFGITREQADELAQEGAGGHRSRQLQGRNHSRGGQNHVRAERQRSFAEIQGRAETNNREFSIRNGRTAARRHFARSSRQTQTRVSPEGHGHGGQQFADERRRRGDRHHVLRSSFRAWD